ncbi:MAG: alpha/beta hydrolase [Chloroflexota bacterium]|nr:alpha/beta hydrolase [Chloroflexota bacterium]
MKTTIISFAVLVLLLALAACDAQVPTPAPEPTTEISEAGEGSAPSSEDLYAVTQSPCDVPPGGDEIEGETIICGTVSVPENYDDPDGNRIPLSYALLKASGDSPAPDPVIFLHGGPGSGELLTLATFVEDFATVRQDRDVLVFDQRGAGFSNAPLDCAMDLIEREEEIADAVAQASPEDADKLRQAKILEICAQAAQERGVDLSQYNTINNARDVQSVVTALGYEDFNLYGHSYGTKLALETMRQQPAGLRSVVVDSVAPPDIELYARSREPALEAAQALFAACAAGDACNAAYPDLEARFNLLMAQLEQAPIVVNEEQSITPAEVIALFNLRNSRYNGPGISAHLPRMIAELEQGVTDTYDGLMDGSLLPPSPFDDEEFVLDEEESPPELTLAETFNFAANSTESLQADPEAKRVYFALPQQPATQAILLDFIDQYIPAADSAALLETAQAMSNDDVAELYTLIRKFAAYQPNPVMATIIVPLHLFVCNESIPFNTMEGAKAYIESAPIPAMTQGALANAANSIELCDGMPTGTVDDSFHDPVASDVPTLVMVGLNDTQTAASWGSVALETLSNGTLATFPESGHGVYQFSQCAREMGAAFFNQPDAALDTACIEELKPEFALP